MSQLLDVRELRVGFVGERGRIQLVLDAVSLTVGERQAVGIVGESGSGKSMFCRALIGTLGRHNARHVSGSILFQGRDLATASEAVWRQVRGRQIGYVPQSSLAALNPLLTIRTQLVEALTSAGRSPAEAGRLLELVRLPRATAVLQERPDALSGGMRQRVMIAAALAGRPALLVADEPTTALDATVQRDILALIAELRQEVGMALILVSHDLAVIEEVCDRVLVMYAGAAVESGSLAEVVGHSRHPYTRALQASRIDRAEPGRDIDAIEGEPPSLARWPSGCRFWPRCELRIDACRADGQPPLMLVGSQLSACIRAAELDGTA